MVRTVALALLVGAAAAQSEAGVTTPVPTKSPDELAAEAYAIEAKALDAAKVEWKKGAWVYGDYAQLSGISSAVECNKLCLADAECSHWNYHATGGNRCDLKRGNTGGFNEDASDWISGDIDSRLGQATTTLRGAVPAPPEAPGDL
eukprot:TRINITY_DN41303_c0_g1_i1.p1 TRINITY_DN41303_c0_g1~~TRINITY_DN41303_c0_g1_i1.p1  ORF type:complete len:146 (-),score=42.76 TRINITY_DN41303_c0_g1_i1:80-517(-)